jgi:type II secretory pathway predicted ATPase ExeA
MIQTISMNIVNNMCEDIQMNSRRAGLLGAPGNGKSTLVSDYCNKDKRNRGVVKMGKSFKILNLYERIYKIFLPDKTNVPNSVYEITMQVSDFMDKSNDKFLLVVDECGKLKSETLEYMHEFMECTVSNCGFVFSGPHYWRDKLDTWIKLKKEGIEEFARRLDEFVEIDGPTKSEMAAYCIYMGIQDVEQIEKIIDGCVTFTDIVNAVRTFLSGKKKK